MKIKILKKAFTLIELLVVITIIGILATGGVSVYTTQIQKARDTVRISAILDIKTAVSQAYQDNFEYPAATNSGFTNANLVDYIANMPEDPKHGQPCNGTATDNSYCGYAYNSGSDDNGIAYATYEVSTAFESTGNRTKKAAEDDGQDDLRLEVGIKTIDLDTALTVEAGAACTVAGGVLIVAKACY